VQIILQMFTPLFEHNLQIRKQQKALSNLDNAHLVEHVQKNWHQIHEELGRWRDILAVPWARTKKEYIP